MCMSYVELSGSQRTHELVREQLGATAGCNSGVHGSFCKGVVYGRMGHAVDAALLPPRQANSLVAV